MAVGIGVAVKRRSRSSDGASRRVVLSRRRDRAGAGRLRPEHAVHPQKAAAIVPKSIEISSIDMEAPLMKLGLKDGEVELPPYEGQMVETVHRQRRAG